MKLLKANLSTGQYLHITVDNPSTVMTHKRMRTSYMLNIGLQEVVVDMIMVMRGTVEISSLRQIFPFFNGNLNIEDFIDWIAEIDKFFDLIEVLEENIVKLMACRLNRGASTWWERLQNMKLHEGKQPVRTWYQKKKLLKKDLLTPDYE